MELQRGREVLSKVADIVPPRVKMKFVGDVPGGQNLVQSHSSRLEAIIILLPTVEIDLQPGEIRGARQRDWALLCPVSRVVRIAEHAPKHVRAIRPIVLRDGTAGEFLDQRGAVSADSGKELRMPECQVQRSISAHRDPGNGAVGATRRHTVMLLDEREEFPHQEIFVAFLAILGVDVEARPAFRRGDQEILQLALLPQVLHQVPFAGVDKELLVVAKPVQEIKDREMARLVRVKRWRQHYAIGDCAVHEFAGQRIAFDAARGRLQRDGHKEQDRKANEQVQTSP